MLSSVLRSKRAIQVNVGIMRTFVRLRQFLASNAQLAHKLKHWKRSTMPKGNLRGRESFLKRAGSDGDSKTGLRREWQILG